jgi:hypothetical protein
VAAVADHPVAGRSAHGHSPCRSRRHRLPDLWRAEKGENSPSEAELKLIETFALAALAAIAAGNLATAPDADVLEGEHVIQSPVTRAPIYLDELRQLIGLTLDAAAGASVAVLLAQLVTTIELGELFAETAATLEGLLGLLLLA